MKKVFLIDENILFNYDESSLKIEGMEIRVRPQCRELLFLLIKYYKFGTFVSLQEIGDTLWRDDGGYGPEMKQSIKDCVTDLRNLLGDADYIKNSRQRGYRLSCHSLEPYNETPEKQESDINPDYNNKVVKNDGDNEIVIKRLMEALKYYDSYIEAISTIRQNIIGTAAFAHDELTKREIHSVVYTKKQEQMALVIKGLSSEKDKLCLAEADLEKSMVHHEITVWSPDNIMSQHFSKKQVDSFFDDIQKAGQRLVEIEEAVSECQRNYYTAIFAFQRDEFFVYKIINRCFNNPRKGSYSIVDYEVFEAKYHYFTNLQDEIRLQNDD